MSDHDQPVLGEDLPRLLPASEAGADAGQVEREHRRVEPPNTGESLVARFTDSPSPVASLTAATLGPSSRDVISELTPATTGLVPGRGHINEEVRAELRTLRKKLSRDAPPRSTAILNPLLHLRVRYELETIIGRCIRERTHPSRYWLDIERPLLVMGHLLAADEFDVSLEHQLSPVILALFRTTPLDRTTARPLTWCRAARDRDHRMISEGYARWKTHQDGDERASVQFVIDQANDELRVLSSDTTAPGLPSRAPDRRRDSSSAQEGEDPLEPVVQTVDREGKFIVVPENVTLNKGWVMNQRDMGLVIRANPVDPNDASSERLSFPNPILKLALATGAAHRHGGIGGAVLLGTARNGGVRYKARPGALVDWARRRAR